MVRLLQRQVIDFMEGHGFTTDRKLTTLQVVAQPLSETTSKNQIRCELMGALSPRSILLH